MRPKNWIFVALLGLAGSRVASNCANSIVDEEPGRANDDEVVEPRAPDPSVTHSASSAAAVTPSGVPSLSATPAPPPSGETPVEIDREVEGDLTIAQGLYGQTTSQSDMGHDNPVRYFPMTVSVFTAKGDGKELATARSDARGFYEIPLEPGAYRACTSFKRCTRFKVKPGQCVRLDYSFSIALGWSLEKTLPCAK
jgi:hypothetical protein